LLHTSCFRVFQYGYLWCRAGRHTQKHLCHCRRS
jgi:hypothetical protein